MTKEVIWGVLVLALILTTYLSHVEDRRHKEEMAKANEDYERKLAELDKAKEQRELEFKAKLAELDSAHAERIREIDDKLAAAAKTGGGR